MDEAKEYLLADRGGFGDDNYTAFMAVVRMAKSPLAHSDSEFASKVQRARDALNELHAYVNNRFEGREW